MQPFSNIARPAQHRAAHKNDILQSIDVSNIRKYDMSGEDYFNFKLDFIFGIVTKLEYNW